MVEILAQTPPIPPGTQWCTFLRNHDELTLEMVTLEDREWMWEQYAPDPRMRINLGIRRRLAPLLDNDIRKLRLINSLLFTLPGSPIIYYGDEIGMGDNIFLHDRDGVRTPMQWNDSPNAGFSSAPEERLFSPVINTPEYHPGKINVENQLKDKESFLSFIRTLINLRKNHPALSRGDLQWADLENDHPSIAAYWRKHDEETALVVQNISNSTLKINVRLPENIAYFSTLIGADIEYHHSQRDLSTELKPFQFLWLKAS